MTQRKAKSEPVSSYTRLNNLKIGESRVNVVGLVLDFSGITEYRKDVYTCRFKLKDESNQEISCVMYHTDINRLPESVKPGDILCIKNAAVKEKEGGIFLNTRKSSTWMIFRKDKEQDKEHALCTSSTEVAETSLVRSRVLQLTKLSGWQDFEVPPDSKKSRLSKQVSPSVPAPSSSSSTSKDSRTQKKIAKPSQPQPSTVHKAAIKGLPPPPPPRVSQPTRNRYYDTFLTRVDKQMVGKRDAGVVGIVKYFKPPATSKGNDYFTALCLVDESYQSRPNGMACVLFNPFKHKLPVVCYPGEVVMLKGLTINNYNGCLQGMGHESCLIGVFPADKQAPLPNKIGDWYTIKPNEADRIKKLILLSCKDQSLLLNSKLNEMTCGNYCSTICYVIATSTTNGSTLLHVYDGTVPKCPDTSVNIHDMFKGMACTVSVSATTKCEVKAGDVILITNLCMTQSSSQEMMELRVSNHSLYQGKIKILPHTSSAVTDFKSSLPIVLPGGLEASLPPSLPLDGIEQATLEEIKNAPLGGTYSAKVRVLGLSPGLYQKVEELSQLRCLGCKTLYVTPRPDDKDFENLLNSGDMCVCCSSEDELLEPNTLSFMYAFSLILEDRTGNMEVAVLDSKQGGSLSQIKLTMSNLYIDSAARDSLLNMLHYMTGGNDPFRLGNHDDTNPAKQRPVLTFHINIYNSCTSHRRYKIIDTNLNQDVSKATV